MNNQATTKEYWEISKEEYEKRFRAGRNLNADQNVFTYGVNNRYVPPLYKPKNFATRVERVNLIFMAGGPIGVYMMHINNWMWSGLINGDLEDMYLYNNSMAAGAQAYPTGIAKYFDLYSWDGYWDYTEQWLINFCYLLLTPFTLFIPLWIWIDAFEYSWDKVWLIFVPMWLGHFLGLEIENNWVMG